MSVPKYYRLYMLDKHIRQISKAAEDKHCIAMVKHYRSLMPMAQEAHKPIFHLKPGDGALGAHNKAVKNAREHFRVITQEILARIQGHSA